MNIRTIIPGVSYVGVNDRTTDLFEALWPLPYGVSLNSYIVEGDNKIALIDSVRISECREFLTNIRNILNTGKAPDYLIVNHMEPDHSGSIPELVRAFPQMKIVGNRQTIGMLKGFYKLEDDSLYLEVKDGSELDLGNKTLRFVLTPMVHWPETMMTYLVEDKVLFSGDAFGTFGALDGGIVDTEMETDRYFPEMYRYYSNIVGKYGKFVQRALAKLKDTNIEYICSTHGPVWHQRLAEVVALTDRLSRYEPEPGVTIIYGSMYGNTAEIAEEIARELSVAGVRNIHVHNAAHSSLSDMISDAYRYEGLIVGSSTYSMGLFPQVEALMSALETREVKNKVFATFGSYTWAKDVVAQKFDEYSARMGMPVVASLTMKQSPDADAIADAKSLANKVVSCLTKK